MTIYALVIGDFTLRHHAKGPGVLLEWVKVSAPSCSPIWKTGCDVESHHERGTDFVGWARCRAVMPCTIGLASAPLGDVRTRDAEPRRGPTRCLGRSRVCIRPPAISFSDGRLAARPMGDRRQYLRPPFHRRSSPSHSRSLALGRADRGYR